MAVVELPIIKTLDDIINLDDRFDINKITLFQMTDDGSLIIPDKNLFDIYRKYLEPYVQTYKVGPAARRYYQFRPHLLSLDLYGTPHLAWMIMMLNDRECPSHFYLKQTARIIPVKDISSAYESIVTRSSDSLTKNWNRFLTRVGEDIGT